MSIEKIDASAARKLFLGGASALNAKKEIINELNVFPVPDGDTGTNMTMTIMSAVKEVEKLPENADMKALCKAIATGSLKGARGNSGVILSQLLRGFTKVIEEHDVVTVPTITAALAKGTETAYKAVMKPKEGTILTVARGISEKASALAESGEEFTVEEYVRQVIEHGEYVLSQTPEMLPVLKEAGVVDSGGQGLIEVLHGLVAVLNGEDIDLSFDAGSGAAEGAVKGAGRDDISTADIRFGYCTEFIIKLERVFNERNEADLKRFLQGIGDSIVCVAMDDIVKIHVHTDHPGKAFEEGLKYGQLTSMKVDNMREEHEERLFHMENNGNYTEIGGVATAGAVSGGNSGDAADARGAGSAAGAAKADGVKKPFGFVTVAAGDGLAEVFRTLGADEVIEGGQTMNPSTDDILTAIKRINAETVFIIPNNKNIILAASQAASMTEDKKAIVIPARTIPQGIAAMISFIPDHDAELNRQEMTESIDTILTGEVTYAVRDTVIDGHQIRNGDIMGIGDHSILAVSQSIDQTVKEMLSSMVDDDSELITLYYGEDIKEDEAEKLKRELESAYPEVAVEAEYGGQPVYYYILSVE
ncbi:MAG: DAK2 domain-containing protein [Lachnospiraceae bacterium]|nr:DAK2 domain-containing protein [Lachnospiraceae bacterium]